MLLKVKVFHDGNHYIGKIPSPPLFENAKPDRIPIREKIVFNDLYAKAQEQGISDKKLCSWIQEESMKSGEIREWLFDDEVKGFVKKNLLAKHKRIKRYEKKIYLHSWNYFVTFTYDDKKESAESFSARLKKAMSNFSSRRSWRYIGVEEHGSKSKRLHYHFVVKVPPGEMVGKLYLDYKRKGSRGKLEYFTNNTYFQERFGQSCWEPITPEDLRTGKVRGYLIKYLQKSGARLIYSRGIPTEIEMEIDTEQDIVCTYKRYSSIRCLLNGLLFGQNDALPIFTEQEETYFEIPRDSFQPWDPLTEVMIA